MNKKIRPIKDGHIIGAIINKAKCTSYDKRLYLLLVLTSETGIKSSELIKLKKSELDDWKLGQVRFDDGRPYKVTKKCIQAIELYKQQGKPFKRMCESDKVFTGKKLSSQKPAHNVNSFVPRFKELFQSVLREFGREKEFNLNEYGIASFRYFYYIKLHKAGASAKIISEMLNQRERQILEKLEIKDKIYIDYL